MANKILKTENLKYGFWGTTRLNYSEKQTEKRWNEVFKTLLKLSGATPEQIREFLDDRFGRHFADDCYKEKDIKQKTKELYFQWIEKKLFDDVNSRKPLETEKETMLFGTRVYNKIYDRVDVVLYTYKNTNRIYQNYAVCISVDEKKYRIGMDYIKPVDKLTKEELCMAGLA